jgi:hypothetical protein
MNDQIQLNIAGLHISICSTHVPILEEQEQAYLAFVERGIKNNVQANIEVDLHLGAPPGVGGWTKIFEDEESWSVFHRENEYLLRYAPPMHGMDPLWLAHMDKKSSRVVVYCNEKLIQRRDGKVGLLNPVRYPLDQFLIMYHLSKEEGALIHAAGWQLQERCIIFPGKSGAGKSTLSRLLSRREDWQGLSDDRVLVRKLEQEFRCFGTPWPGEEGHALNLGVNLSDIFFLHHGSNNRMLKLNSGEALKRLLPVVSIPWYDQETCMRIIQFCEELLSKIPAYELCFTPTLEIIDLLEECCSAGRGMVDNGRLTQYLCS